MAKEPEPVTGSHSVCASLTVTDAVSSLWCLTLSRTLTLLPLHPGTLMPQGTSPGLTPRAGEFPGQRESAFHLSPCSWAPGRPGFVSNVTATGPAGLRGSDGHRVCPLSLLKQQPHLCVQVAGGPLPLILVLKTCLHGASLQGLGLPPTRPVFPEKVIYMHWAVKSILLCPPVRLLESEWVTRIKQTYFIFIYSLRMKGQNNPCTNHVSFLAFR